MKIQIPSSWYTYLTCFLILLPDYGLCQSIFHLNDIVCNDTSETIDFFLSTYKKDAHQNINGLVVPDPSLFSITEQVSTEINPLSIKNISLLETGTVKNTNILFLFDYSGSMLEKGYLDAELMAKNLLDANISIITSVRVGWLNNEGLNKTAAVENYEQLQNEKKSFSSSKNADLLTGLIQALDFFEEKNKLKIILLFTNGKSIYKKEDEINKLKDKISAQGNDILIFPIGVGEISNQLFLAQLSSLTTNQYDTYSNLSVPDKVFNFIQNGSSEYESNLKISVNPTFDKAILGQEKRTYKVTYKGTETYQYSKVMISSSSINKCDLRPIVEFSTWNTFTYGLSIISLLLSLLWFVLPLYNRFYFKRNHVKKYKHFRKEGVTALDPLELSPIKDDDRVVAIGKKVMLLNTWKSLRDNGQGEIAKDHAEFFENHLSLNFFSQKGAFQRLNWLWFGALGGFLSWCINIALNNTNSSFFYNILKNILDTPGKEVASAVHNSIISGLALGIGICTTLALVEEIGQSRKFSLLRVLLRSIIGALIAIPIFFLESYISSSYLNFNYLGGLVGWTIFGTTIGLVVTSFSNIEKKNGLIGGFIAGVIAFHLYYFLQNTPQIIDLISSDFAKMLSFIAYGALLGLILFSVVTRLEDFELEYLSPQGFNGQVKAISKWLKSSSVDGVYIGTDATCEVYVKWEDNFVKPKHAKLTYENGKVIINTIGDAEVFINDILIRERRELHDGDKIKLGPESISIMRFKSKDAINNNHEEVKKKTKKVAVRVTKRNIN